MLGDFFYPLDESKKQSIQINEYPYRCHSPDSTGKKSDSLSVKKRMMKTDYIAKQYAQKSGKIDIEIGNSFLLMMNAL
jgi:hypothetical protein